MGFFCFCFFWRRFAAAAGNKVYESGEIKQNGTVKPWAIKPNQVTEWLKSSSGLRGTNRESL